MRSHRAECQGAASAAVQGAAAATSGSLQAGRPIWSGLPTLRRLARTACATAGTPAAVPSRRSIRSRCCRPLCSPAPAGADCACGCPAPSPSRRTKPPSCGAPAATVTVAIPRQGHMCFRAADGDSLLDIQACCMVILARFATCMPARGLLHDASRAAESPQVLQKSSLSQQSCALF